MKQERDIKTPYGGKKRKRRNSLRLVVYVGALCLIIYGIYYGVSTFGHWDLGRRSVDRVSGTGNARMNDQNQNNNQDKNPMLLNEKLDQLIQEDSSLQVIKDQREKYPDQLVYLLVHNKETKDFVLDYPNQKKLKRDLNIHANEKKLNIPLFLQWDKRWGYENYGDEMICVDGCGPTCLSMVYSGLTKDYEKNPFWMSQYSFEHGFYSAGATKWNFMLDAAKDLGLGVRELPLNEERILDNLKVGNPIICIMGPGAFTSKGHFIVLAGYEDGKILVCDPNSKERSKKKWDYSEFSDQIRNLWVYWKS